ncbi:hypothetical protein EBU99_09060 [bacterium]|nr:hypothetical protein [bacterium]
MMKSIVLLTSVFLVPGCLRRTYNELESKEPSQTKGVAKVIVESTSVRQLIRVIGIEKDEAACVGGNPKYSLQVKSGSKIEIEVPTSVTKIGLCGQATPTGMDYKHISVDLKDGETIVIVDDKLKQ